MPVICSRGTCCWSPDAISLISPNTSIFSQYNFSLYGCLSYKRSYFPTFFDFAYSHINLREEFRSWFFILFRCLLLRLLFFLFFRLFLFWGLLLCLLNFGLRSNLFCWLFFHLIIEIYGFYIKEISLHYYSRYFTYFDRFFLLN